MIDTHGYEKYLYSVIYLPAETSAQLPLDVHPRLRVEGEINDYPFSGAFIPSSQGHHPILGSARLKAMGLNNQIRRFCWVLLVAQQRMSDT